VNATDPSGQLSWDDVKDFGRDALDNDTVRSIGAGVAAAGAAAACPETLGAGCALAGGASRTATVAKLLEP
jgi:hypothetical protein